VNGCLFPALASQVSVSVIGVGSYLPDHRVSNQEILKYLRPARPDGRLLEPEWVVKHLGIHERRLDYEFGGRRKRSRPDGGIYDGDLAMAAARSALSDAGIDAADVDVFVHVTSTPDTISCQDHFRFLAAGLGLRRDAGLVHHNLGCAGLASGFGTVAAALISMLGQRRALRRADRRAPAGSRRNGFRRRYPAAGRATPQRTGSHPGRVPSRRAGLGRARARRWPAVRCGAARRGRSPRSRGTTSPGHARGSR
jgi:hypothetical protein